MNKKETVTDNTEEKKETVIDNTEEKKETVSMSSFKNLSRKKLINQELADKCEKQLKKGTIKVQITMDDSAPSLVTFNGVDYKIPINVPVELPIGVVEMLSNKTKDIRPRTPEEFARYREARYALQNLSGNPNAPTWVVKVPLYNIMVAE